MHIKFTLHENRSAPVAPDAVSVTVGLVRTFPSPVRHPARAAVLCREYLSQPAIQGFGGGVTRTGIPSVAAGTASTGPHGSGRGVGSRLLVLRMLRFAVLGDCRRPPRLSSWVIDMSRWVTAPTTFWVLLPFRPILVAPFAHPEIRSDYLIPEHLPVVTVFRPLATAVFGRFRRAGQRMVRSIGWKPGKPGSRSLFGRGSRVEASRIAALLRQSCI